MSSLIENIYHYSRRMYSASKSYRKQYAQNQDRNIRFYNWWNEPYEQLWLYRFVKHRNIVPDDKILNFISVFGKQNVVDCISDGPVVFFTGENVHNAEHQPYADYLLDRKNVKLALGFDWITEPNYMRFPLWIPFLFDPTLDEIGIRKRCAELRHPNIGERNKFAALVARYDWNGSRTQIYDVIKHIAQINCPSIVNHNDDDLKSKYRDNKIDYLRQFAFNICPENSNSYGYVTEKVFEAIDAGCIPIYWGSYNMPEVKVLNQDVIVKWNMNGDNAANTQLLEDLYTHPDRLMEYMMQPRLLANAEEWIIQCEMELSNKLKMMLQ